MRSIGPPPSPASRPSRIAAAVALASLAACSGMTPGGGTSTASGAASGTGREQIPAAIAVPTAKDVVARLRGAGFQNYECRPKGAAYEWTFVAPEAALRDAGDNLVGRHFAGPTWEYGDGSRVTGKVVATAPAPDAGNLPWLLLQGTASGTGTLSGVTYVQRLNTSGGVTPSDPCAASNAGAKKQVRYTADYWFYR